MRIKSFYEPILRADVTCLTDTTPKQIENYLEKKKGYLISSGFDTCAGSVTLLDKVDKKGGKTREYLITIEDSKGFYTLLHEVVHLVSHILNDRMIPFNIDNGEIIAYFQEYWFRTLWRFLSKKTVKIIKK